MTLVAINFSDELAEHIANRTRQVSDGQVLLEMGIENIKDGAELLDKAGICGTLTLTIELGADGAGS